jgi:type II secretory pathway pseudopilin PulG
MRAISFQPNLRKKSGLDGALCQRMNDEQGIAMVLVLIVLSILAVFSAYLFLSSAEELKISDNSESMIQARFAARAGIDHARELLKGLNFSTVLKGPDGTFTNTSSYLTAARTASFRNSAPWALLRSLNIADPSSDVSSLADDGLINNGGTTPTVFVPKTGLAFTVANPYGSGTLTTARYFIKVTDNNGEASEIASDSTDSPFIDGDGTIIVRSVGVAKTIVEGSGSSARRNSVAIFESRLMQGSPFFDLGSPAIVIGHDVAANFSGNAFSIIGTTAGPGLATIDTDLPDCVAHPANCAVTKLRAATGGKGTITGNCTGATQNQCIMDITLSVRNDPKKSMLMDPVWLYDFANNQVPAVADNIITNGSIGTANLGTTSNPKITFVQGDLSATGGITGAGILVVTGELAMGGSIQFDGLVLVVGKGEFWAHGMNRGIHGGLIVANINVVNGVPVFGRASTSINDFDIRGNSDISTYDGSLANMGNGLMPLKQLSFREITNGLDP